MSRGRYSRLVVLRKAKEDSLIGLLSLFGPLGYAEEGRDLVACFREADDARRAGFELTSRRIRHTLVTDIPEEDPLEAYRTASRPFAVGRRFWIDPGDPSDSEPPEGRIALRLPASRAFGTGEHETTRLALLALEEEPLEGVSVLDAGTGSGVLALAAAALGAVHVVACDSDPQAAFVARENLRLHSFGGRVKPVAAPLDSLGGSFPLVVANLLPEEFLPIRGNLFSLLAPRGHLILSGIPAERENEVLSRLRSKRRPLCGRRSANGWTCVCVARD